ncbi:hypothetical protein F2P44_23745 [Massilia sp. CCM 8695]|uniref:Integrase catalytic domain-containing protein n=1 Tax=Massilia frigida TaxID=2609281 RepID=A0ABX0NI04_9BURK|nr:hypothetical protein [Massilia frigida]NHZ82268.1 hypothetical protein [Massilia frigida]
MTGATIEVGDVILVASDESTPMNGPYRVLEVFPKRDRVTLIPIPTGPRIHPGRKQASYYAKGFISHKLSQLEFWLETKRLQITTLELPSHWHLSDVQLRELFPPEECDDLAPEDRGRSPLEIKRDFRWMLIAPMVESMEASTGTRPPDLTCLDAQVRERARELKVSAGQVYNALHRYYAFGGMKNSLLPDTTARSGAPGKPRRGKNGVKLGRKNAAAKAGDTERAGFILTDKDVQNLEDGYATFVVPGTGVKQAYLSMSAAYYSTGHTLKHGHLVTNLLDAHLRPTKSDFIYHGSRAQDAGGAARRLMGEGVWARNYRPLVGTARDGITTIGQVGSLDASPVDVNFVACGDPLQPIGVGRGLFVRDAWLGLYLGWRVAINGLGTDDAKLAILRGATDKASMLARYGLDLPSDDFPSMFCSKYFADNGELRSFDGIDSVVKQLSSRIEFIASGRADRNSSSESGHHVRHRSLDHHITGTTKGRPSKRGEPLAISKALISRFAYERLLILWIHWANTQQELPLHMVPAEMRREFAAEGKTAGRTRIAIYRWARKNGYVTGKPMDPSFLRSHLLPRFTASVQRGGLVLHRPNTGNTVELLHGARFNHDYLAQSGIIRDAISSGKKHIEVRVDPDDLSHLILVDRHGAHIIPNIKDDVILIQEGGVPDLCALNDAEKMHGVVGATSRDQADVEQQSFRNDVEAVAREKQAAARKSLGSKASPNAKRAGVRAAQALEQRRELDDEARRVAELREPQSDTPPEPSPRTAEQACAILHAPVEDGVNRLMELRKSRLSRFHNERKH